MTQSRQETRRGPLYRTGAATLLVLWNGGLIWLAEHCVHEYNRCVADGGIVCADYFSGPIFVIMFTVDAVVAVRWLRARRSDPSE